MRLAGDRLPGHAPREHGEARPELPPSSAEAVLALLMQALATGSRHAVELVDRGMTWAGKEGLFLSYQPVDSPGQEPHEAWAVRIEPPAPKPGA